MTRPDISEQLSPATNEIPTRGDPQTFFSGGRSRPFGSTLVTCQNEGERAVRWTFRNKNAVKPLRLNGANELQFHLLSSTSKINCTLLTERNPIILSLPLTHARAHTHTCTRETMQSLKYHLSIFFHKECTPNLEKREAYTHRRPTRQQ